MNIGSTVYKRIQQARRALTKYFEQNGHPSSVAAHEELEVFAVTNCYPMRIVLYAAAFQGKWKVHFMKSLRMAQEATSVGRPMAILYDHNVGDLSWDQYCSAFSREGIPFILVANRDIDQNFLLVLAAGGYQAWGNPLTSEELVKVLRFAAEVAELAHVPVR